ncbi:MAG: aflatoxin B1 aldehyde reductase [Flavobacteriales bacterium]|jgi:aflatoxin B1 aldehyde reductase
MKKILGTMTFSDQVNQAEALAMMTQFSQSGGHELDTAYVYCEGRTETMLGALLPAAQRQRVFLASKVHPWNDQGLQPDQVQKQLNETLSRLDTDYVDLLYLHSPDLDTAVELTLERCFELYQQGKFKTFGLSNFASWQVAEVVEICRRNGWMQPTVYQGMYNAMTRDVETELFPCLRHYDMHFYAYNPLAGGLLTGKHQSIQSMPDTGRFRENYGYRSRYWKDDYFSVLDDFQRICADVEITPVNAAFSWLINHSKLSDELGDGIILGASKVSQLTDNLSAFNQGPLHESILEVLDRGWEVIKPNCFRYFRP